MNIEQLEYGIVQYGTPMYAFDIDQVLQRVRWFQELLGHEVSLCFAMKANPFLAKYLAEAVDRVEVCSMGEFRICRNKEITPEKILVSGVRKKKEDIYEILDTFGERCSFSVESLKQFQNIADWCSTNKTSIDIYLRLTSGNQFGMDLQTIKNIIDMRRVCTYLHIKGIHYFSGTQKKSVQVIRRELRYLDDVFLELKEELGFCVEELEYGPGLAAVYFAGQEDTTEEQLKQLKDFLLHMRWKGKVTLEIGRALTADCGYYLTQVQDIKQNDGRNYCIVDGGIHQMNYDGQVRGMYTPSIQVSPRREAGVKKEWMVCGSLCTANDVLAQKAEFVDLKVGNILIFERTGAYSMTEGMALFLSHELPGIAVYSETDGWKLLRKNQATFEWNMGGNTKDEYFDRYFNGNR
ncbi:MAG: alanine racemase [Lachnospiraceae bacterium]|nr:alanine racemase [Lachnospiraceae bacterium]